MHVNVVCIKLGKRDSNTCEEDAQKQDKTRSIASVSPAPKLVVIA